MIDLYKFENELYQKGYKNIAGVDEAGRGPMAGPVVAASCILPKGFVLVGLNDSKQLSQKKLDKFYEIIIKEAVDYKIAFIDSKTIDQVNIYQATKLAMKEVINNINCDYVLIDAMKMELDIEHNSIIKGDTLSISIAAASVIAKVSRDRYMEELHNKHPQYGFETHKGYVTKKHKQAIKDHGVIDEHRRSFKPVKDIIDQNK